MKSLLAERASLEEMSRLTKILTSKLIPVKPTKRAIAFTDGEKTIYINLQNVLLQNICKYFLEKLLSELTPEQQQADLLSEIPAFVHGTPIEQLVGFVEWSKDDSAFREPRKHAIAVLKGLTDHECGHVIFTDNAAWIKGIEDALASNVYRIYAGLFRDLMNALEDHRINRCMAVMYPGSRKFIRLTYEWAFKDFEHPAVDERKYPAGVMVFNEAHRCLATGQQPIDTGVAEWNAAIEQVIAIGEEVRVAPHTNDAVFGAFKALDIIIPLLPEPSAYQQQTPNEENPGTKKPQKAPQGNGDYRKVRLKKKSTPQPQDDQDDSSQSQTQQEQEQEEGDSEQQEQNSEEGNESASGDNEPSQSGDSENGEEQDSEDAESEGEQSSEQASGASEEQDTSEDDNSSEDAGESGQQDDDSEDDSNQSSAGSQSATEDTNESEEDTVGDAGESESDDEDAQGSEPDEEDSTAPAGQSDSESSEEDDQDAETGSTESSTESDESDDDNDGSAEDPNADEELPEDGSLSEPDNASADDDSEESDSDTDTEGDDTGASENAEDDSLPQDDDFTDDSNISFESEDDDTEGSDSNISSKATSGESGEDGDEESGANDSDSNDISSGTDSDETDDSDPPTDSSRNDESQDNPFDLDDDEDADDFEDNMDSSSSSDSSADTSSTPSTDERPDGNQDGGTEPDGGQNNPENESELDEDFTPEAEDLSDIDDLVDELLSRELKLEEAEKEQERITNQTDTEFSAVNADTSKYGNLHKNISVETKTSQARLFDTSTLERQASRMEETVVRGFEDMMKRKKSRYRSHLQEGEIDPIRLIQGEFGDDRIFRQPLRRDKNDMVVVAMTDESGSMSWDSRFVAATGANIMLHGVLRRLNIPHQQFGFSAFSGRNAVLHRPYVLFENCSQPNLHISCGTFDNARDGLSIRLGAQMLLQRPERQKLLLVITDGIPEHGAADHDYTDKLSLNDTAEAVRDAERLGIRVVGVSIGEDDNYMPAIYTNRVCVQRLSELPQKLVSVLKQTLQ